MKQLFEDIYAREAWGKGRGSGRGSTPRYCAKYLAFLTTLLETHDSVLDLGCGDWQMYAGFDWRGALYTGVDVVPALIAANEKRYGNREIQFVCADFSQPSIMADVWRADPSKLVLVKDVLQHWADADIERWLKTVQRMRWHTLVVVNSWHHVRQPANNGKPRNLDNAWHYAPVDMRKYGFTVELTFPAQGYKQVAVMRKKA